MAGLTAVMANNTLAVTWEGDNGAELRMALGIDRGTPTIREIAIRKKGGQWNTLATNVVPARSSGLALACAALLSSRRSRSKRTREIQR